MDAVILAAGEGTRLRPLTSTRPKPMLPIAGKPILEWNLEALDCAKVKKAYIVVGYKKEVIKDYFGGQFRGVKLEYIEQKAQLGTGDALLAAKDRIKRDFLVLNGDIFITRKFVQTFRKQHEKAKPKASISLVEVSDPRSYGVCEVNRGKVNRDKVSSRESGTRDRHLRVVGLQLLPKLSLLEPGVAPRPEGVGK